MRQLKKLTWLQALILGDVRVIGYNSLRDSLFQIHVMDFVEIVIDLYVYITSHVSQAYASCTHYTSYSLLNCVHDIVCVFGLTNQVWEFLEFDAEHVCLFEFFFLVLKENFALKEIWIEFICFWKTSHLILMHFSHKIWCFERWLHWNWCVFQKINFSRISIDRRCFSTDRKCFKINGKVSGWLDRSTLNLDQSKLFLIDRM